MPDRRFYGGSRWSATCQGPIGNYMTGLVVRDRICAAIPHLRPVIEPYDREHCRLFDLGQKGRAFGGIFLLRAPVAKAA